MAARMFNMDTVYIIDSSPKHLQNEFIRLTANQH